MVQIRKHDKLQGNDNYVFLIREILAIVEWTIRKAAYEGYHS